jgi:hypothetical protein
MRCYLIPGIIVCLAVVGMMAYRSSVMPTGWDTDGYSEGLDDFEPYPIATPIYTVPA